MSDTTGSVVENDYRVLAAIDGGARTTAVLDLAAATALARGGKVIVLHVRRGSAPVVIPGSPPMTIFLPEESADEADVMLQAAALHLKEQGVGSDCKHCGGKVGPEIVKAAGELTCHCVVVGACKPRFLNRPFHHGVDAYLKEHAGCTVLIADRDDSKHETPATGG